MNVLVTGATGFIGSHLTRHLESVGHTVLAVSRRPGARYNFGEVADVLLTGQKVPTRCHRDAAV